MWAAGDDYPHGNSDVASDRFTGGNTGGSCFGGSGGGATIVSDAAVHGQYCGRVLAGLVWSRCFDAGRGSDCQCGDVGGRSGLPAVCVDCGTAITLEIVGNGPRFAGGSIAPGRSLMRQALHDHTAQLPLLPVSDELADELGVNTVSAMTQGIDRGAVGMVRELLAQVRNCLGAKMTAVAVGGDRHFFLHHLPELTDGGDDFTLRGIFKIWEKNYAS